MFVNIGFGNFVNADRIVAVCRYDSSPMKRMVTDARSSGAAVDATQGRKTKAVLTMADGQVVLSALLPETISARCNGISVKDAEAKEEEKGMAEE